VGGMAVLYGALGTLVALLGWQFGAQLGSPFVVVPLALFFIAMAASMFGAFELALPAGLQTRLARVGGQGPGGAFLMGLVAGLIAAPCTGPPLLGILAYVSTTRDAVYGFSLLATYALGIGVPFWAIAGMSMSMPRPGPWMEAIKSVFGIAMLVMAYYFLRPVIPALRGFARPELAFMIGAVAVVVGGIVVGAIHLTFHDAGVLRARTGVGVALAALGLFAATDWVLLPPRLSWHKAEAVALAEAEQSARPMLIDFMAEWCLPCKELELKVFADPRVSEEMRSFVLLKIDLTRELDDPALAAVKAKYGAETLPAVRLVSPKGSVLASVNELPTAEAFLAHLKAARTKL
jgi:thioredoxin:protein disulfide reductase